MTEPTHLQTFRRSFHERRSFPNSNWFNPEKDPVSEQTKTVIIVYVGESTVKDILTLYNLRSAIMEWQNVVEICLQNMHTNCSIYGSDFRSKRYVTTQTWCIAIVGHGLSLKCLCHRWGFNIFGIFIPFWEECNLYVFSGKNFISMDFLTVKCACFPRFCHLIAWQKSLESSRRMWRGF